MRFGIRCSEGGAKFSQALEEVLRAEELGFDSVFLGEHHGFEDYWPSPQIALAAMAARSTRILLGTNIAILPLANPVRLAGEFALLDQISEGRAILGVGTGWSRQEFASLAAPYEKRGQRLEEYVSLIRRLWTEPEVTFSGAYYELQAFSLAPRPVQRPHPPIWIGGRSPRSIDLAARLGDAWIPDLAVSLDELMEGRQRYEMALTRFGRDHVADRPLTRRVVLGRSNREAWRSAGPYFQRVYKDQLQRGNPIIKRAYRDDLAEFVRGRYIVGDAVACREEVARLRDVGISHLILKFAPGIASVNPIEAMEIFAKTVAPSFR
jgi:probable F420-dependent oxidoreductase